METTLRDQIKKGAVDLEREQVQNQRILAELNELKAESRNIAGMDGRDVKDMMEKNKDLENQVNMLLGERQQVVCLNKDDGTMECIAQDRSLEYPNSVSGRANSVKDIVDQMQAWLKKYDNRITVKSIF